MKKLLLLILFLSTTFYSQEEKLEKWNAKFEDRVEDIAKLNIKSAESFNLLAQSIKSKDGIILGDRKDFIEPCIESGLKQSQKLNIGVVEVGWDEYCNCVVDRVLPNITSGEMLEAVKENDLMSLFFKEGNLELILSCVEGFASKNEEALSNLELKKNSDPRYAKLQKDLSINECIKYSKKDQNYSNKEDFLIDKAIEDYCNCAVEKMFDGGYTFGQMLEADDENSDAFNEIVMACLSEVLQVDENYNLNSTISGGGVFSMVPLTNYFGNGYKVKIKIGGEEKYFLLDTGASDIIIDRDFERELLLNGVLSRKDYVGKADYIMANNKVIKADLVKIKEIEIGDYIINDVVIGIIDEGALLCGISFLDLFKKWEIDKDSNSLILYK